MKALVLMLTAFGALATPVAGRVSISSLDFADSITRRDDGQYDIVCMDGASEVRTLADLRADRVCTHIQKSESVYRLLQGGETDGVVMCNLKVITATSTAGLLGARAEFVDPCVGPAGDLTCTSGTCTGQLGATVYNFDFSVGDQLTLTRVSDGFAAVFSTTGPLSVKTRTATMGIVQNVLQVSEDGLNWLPVCDDNFDAMAAKVACKEMGYSSGTYRSVSVSGSNQFGLDDVSCNGTEASIWDCRHTTFGNHNCSESEHVQLTCQ